MSWVAVAGAGASLIGGASKGGGGGGALPSNISPNFGSVTYGPYNAKPGPNWGLIALIVGLAGAVLLLLFRKK